MQPNTQVSPELTWDEFCKAVRRQLRVALLPLSQIEERKTISLALNQTLHTQAQVSDETESREWREELQKKWARAENKIQQRPEEAVRHRVPSPRRARTRTIKVRPGVRVATFVHKICRWHHDERRCVVTSRPLPKVKRYDSLFSVGTTFSRG